MFQQVRESAAFAALVETSARLGSDPLQVQGPGGNTSLKSGDAMWIKASGTWLAEAGARDIWVPCDAGVIRRALATGEGQPEIAAIVPAAHNAGGLRPSIETAVHAALDWPVVLHTHCVATLALAVCRDAPARIAAALPGVDLAFVPYVKPGWDLARAIRAAARPGTEVVVLGNHGLVVCGETATEAEATLRRVTAALEPAGPRPGIDPDGGFAARLEGSGWVPAPEAITHAVARDPQRMALALGATLYPDHLIFLGPGCRAVGQADPLPAVDTGGAPCRILICPGEGVGVPEGASLSELALARCLGDVLARVPSDAEPLRLSPEDEAALLDWDAEKYRQSLNKAG